MKFLFRVAWNDDTRLLNNAAILLEVEDMTKIIFHGAGDRFSDWLRRNSQTYELKVPAYMASNIFQMMRNDMNISLNETNFD